MFLDFAERAVQRAAISHPRFWLRIAKIYRLIDLHLSGLANMEAH